jgi:hypothetical protein
MWFSQYTVLVYLNSINELASSAAKQYASCEVRTECIYQLVDYSVFRGLAFQ